MSRIQDAANFTSKMTWRKMSNVIQLKRSYWQSQRSGLVNLKGKPMTISVEPTTACNLRCPECPSGLRAFTRPTGNLKTDFFRSMVDQIGSQLTYLIFYFQGEPYINPNFLDMVQHASSKNIYSITSTNGHFLDHENAGKTVEAGLDRLLISVDGASQKTYESYRKAGSLEQVIEGIENIVAAKKKMKARHLHIVMQFLVVKPNEHEIPAIKSLAKKLGVDELKLKTAQIYDYKNGNELIPSIEKYSRYKLVGENQYALKYPMENKCWKMWHSCVLTWDGRVVPCCFDKDAKYVLGDLKMDTFNDIWTSSKYDRFRKTILKGRSNIDICTNCTEGLNEWA